MVSDNQHQSGITSTKNSLQIIEFLKTRVGEVVKKKNVHFTRQTDNRAKKSMRIIYHKSPQLCCHTSEKKEQESYIIYLLHTNHLFKHLLVLVEYINTNARQGNPATAALHFNHIRMLYALHTRASYKTKYRTQKRNERT